MTPPRARVTIGGEPPGAGRLNVRHTASDVVDTLGPGRRAVVWVQGCTLHCPGCIVPEMWNPATAGRLVDPTALARELLGDDPDLHLTVSGGEPTEQAAPVAALLRAARELGRNTWVYTGRTLEELAAADDPDVDALLAEVDVLVDGRYVQELAGTFPYRGSSNQRILRLTDAISAADADSGPGGRLSLSLDNDGTLVVIGVPPPGLLPRLREGLAARGVTVDPEHAWR